MSKGGARQPTSEGAQTDLFGTPAAPGPAKKARAAPGARAPFAKGSPTPLQKKVVHEPDALLNVRQAASRLGLSKSTLDKMRGAGKGPRFIKSTDRAVRYDPIDLDAWIAARRSASES
jgi:predicted DNA-binding transcriptional regulator AlpA